MLDRDLAEQDARATAPEFPPSFRLFESARERYFRATRAQSERYLAERAIREVFQSVSVYHWPGVRS